MTENPLTMYSPREYRARNTQLRMVPESRRFPINFDRSPLTHHHGVDRANKLARVAYKGWTAIALLGDLTCWESSAKERSAFRSCAILSQRMGDLRAMDKAKNHDSWNAFKSFLSPKPRVVFLRPMLTGCGELQLTTSCTQKKKVILSQTTAERQILKYEDVELDSRISS